MAEDFHPWDDATPEPLPPEAALVHLSRLLARLGWEGERLRMNRNPDSGGMHPLMDVYFTIGDMADALYLQINPLPIQHPRLYGIAVYAMRARICSGWHGALLDVSASESGVQLQRLQAWVGFKNFSTATSRRAYRQAHPECGGWSWRRIRQQPGPPYCQTTCWERLR